MKASIIIVGLILAYATFSHLSEPPANLSINPAYTHIMQQELYLQSGIAP